MATTRTPRPWRPGLFGTILLVLGAATPLSAMAQSVGTCEPALGDAYLDVNNVRARILNNGGLFYRGEPHVYNVPKDSPSNAIFATNIWIGGYVGDEPSPRMAASTYGPWEFWAGPLDDAGNPPADCGAYDRLYNVYRADIDAYVATGVVTDDLRDWPTGLGAPTLAPPGNGRDDDGDGTVDEAGEEIAFDITVPLAERKDRVIDLEAGERPAIPGDQAIWWVMNDLGNTHERTRANPVGVEVHGMAFAFDQRVPTSSGTSARFGPVSEMTFYRYRLYFRGPQPLERAYFGIKVDPDLGDFADDYVGSDTTLGLGYVYNSDNNDESGEGYGTPPPAVGFDFFQGPIVPSAGDTAYVSGRPVPDHRTLQMTTFGGIWKSGTCGDESFAHHFYNEMDARCHDGSPWTIGGSGQGGVYDNDPGGTNIPTRFIYPGDPVTNTGWTERNPDPIGNSSPPLSPGDRRFLLATGPFTITPGDAQEIVFGVVYARGTDNWESVAALRRADQVAQSLYEGGFRPPAPPDAPEVTVTALDREVTVEWTNPPSSNNFLDGYVQFNPMSLTDPGTPRAERSYRFEGYDLIQYADAADMEGEIVATYDLVNGVTRIVDGVPNELNQEFARGTDSGIEHIHRFQNLTNFRTYHFGIRAYAYNARSFPRILRGETARFTATPARSEDDVSEAARAAAEDRATPDFVATTASPRDARIWADVVNPARVRNATYSIAFYEMDAPAAGKAATPDEPGTVDAALKTVDSSSRATAVTYDILRDGEVMFDGSAAGRPAPFQEDVAIIDGLRFNVLSPGVSIKGFAAVANSAGPIAPPDMAAFAFNGWGFPILEGAVTPEGSYPAADRPTRGVQQALSDAAWGFHVGGGTGPYDDGSFTSFVTRALRNGLEVVGTDDYEMRFTQECADGIDGTVAEGDCLAFRAFEDGELVEVPFELWNVGIAPDASDDFRMIPVICEEACGGGTEPLKFDIGSDHPVSGGVDDPFSDWIYWYLPEDGGAAPGEDGYNGYFFGDLGIGSEVIARTVLVNWNGGEAPPYVADLPETGTVFRIVTTKPPAAGDVFTFNTEGYGVTSRPRTNLAAIGVVPNPYIGVSQYERSPAVDEVRFTNLPEQATIRIFTLHGTLIRTIRKDSPEPYLAWNLRTDNDLPIGSGMYLIHVEVPGVGSQTIKFAVVKKQVNPVSIRGF